MNAEVNFYRQIFKDFMPAWSERGGYIEGYKGYQYLYPENIAPIPIQFAPASSLDGLFIDIEHAPASPQMLVNYIQTIAPGGITIVHLSYKFWNKKMIYNTFHTAGFEILYFSKIPELKYIHYDSGYFKTKGLLPYLFFASFPFTPYSYKRNYFIIAKKNFYKNYDKHLQFSIILILPEQKEKAHQKLLSWEEFLQEHKIHNIELVVVKNSHKDINEKGYSQMQIIHHYEKTFTENAIYSGIYKSKGKIVLIDMDSSVNHPSLFFEAFDHFLKNQSLSTKPLAIYAYPLQEKNQFLKKIYYKLIYGIKHPTAKYRLYNQKSIELFYKYHPYTLKQNPYLIEKEIKKHKGKIIEIPYNLPYKPLKKKSIKVK
ncbi:MAG: hypothetical protein KatS3mg129_2196 [Leptospiraceae bacterium]|nr:MAG: hypothetical protein KatS3mg129_2196 [Leptospiraceae bacterium]